MREENLTLVRSAYDAFTRGDFDTLRSMFAEEVVWHTPGIHFEPTYKGMDGVFTYFTELVERTDGTFRVEPQHMYADDERVVVVERVSGSRHDHHVEFPDVIVYEFRDGKVSEVTQYEVDVATLETFWA